MLNHYGYICVKLMPEYQDLANDWFTICKYRKAEYVQRRVCFVNVQSSLHENVVFSVSVGMCHAAYVIFIMWNSISGLDACYHFQLNISCGVAVTVRSHQKKNIR